MFTLNASADQSSRITDDTDPFLISQVSIMPYRCSPVFGGGRARQTDPQGLFLTAAATTMLRPAKFAIKATTRNGALRNVR
jgi:hypothetical protein